MSEVKVNKVSPRSGTTVTIGDSGDTINLVGTLQNNGSPLTGDISSVVAGTGLSGGATSGVATLNIEAAQPTITSLGTITSFRSTGIDDNCSALRMTLTNDDTTMGGHLKLDYASANGNPKISFLQNNYSGATNIEVNRTGPHLLFNVNASERMRITSGGGVGIATSSIINGEKLKVQGKVYINAPESNTAFTVGACLIFPETYNNIRQSTDHALNFDTYNGGSVLTPLTIKQDGKIGIGETAPLGLLHVKSGDSGVTPNGNADDLFIENNGASGITIGSSVNEKGNIFFADSGNALDGYIQYAHDSRYLRFATATLERMRINSDGRLLVGKTDTARTTVGSEIRGDGFIRGTKSGGHSFDAVRTSDQGDVIRIYSENNLVGVLGTEKWGIGTSAPSTTLDVVGNATITTADNSNTLSLVSTDADANAGPILSMRRESATPADNDLIGQVDFMGKDSGGVNTQYASIKAIIKDATNNTEDGALEFVNYKSGFLNNALTLGNTETVFNDASLGIDFRVESNGNANMLLVDGSADRVGIGTANPQNKLDIVATTWNEGLTIKTTGNTNVGIITDSNRTTAGGGLFNLQARWNGTEVAGILFQAGSDTTNKDDGEILFRVASAGTPSEKLRIGTSGRFHTNATTSPNGQLNLIGERGGSYRAIVFEHTSGGGGVGDIRTTSSSVIYNTSSDYRLKENVSYDFDATARLKQLKPAKFNFIADADTTVDGFIAHEVSSIVPEAISGTKDETETKEKVVVNANDNVIAENIEQADWETGKIADEDGNTQYPTDSTWEATKVVPVYQGIDQSKLVPLLVKTIQELEARITTLENN